MVTHNSLFKLSVEKGRQQKGEPKPRYHLASVEFCYYLALDLPGTHIYTFFPGCWFLCRVPIGDFLGDPAKQEAPQEETAFVRSAVH